MKLYFISQEENVGYDTYSDAVVAALNEEDARKTHPNGEVWESDHWTWCKSPKQVKVRLIGDAIEGTKAGVICSSFHAG